MKSTKKVREWDGSSVVYHIYVRSFKDTNDDGIGDLRGVILNLDYIKSLGVDAIWLSPITSSPNVDYGYDVSDYCTIDTTFGNMNDFDDLIKEAHARDIKILMDYVPNHTSSEHPWFLESRASRDNPKRDWYIWKDSKPDGTPPNNWLSVFGGSAWEKDEKTGQYYLHTFAVHQPDLNWRNPAVVKEMLDVFRFWMKRGVDGFRIDAVYFLFKDERFLDEPSNPSYIIGTHEPYDMLQHPYTLGLPEVLIMLGKMMRVMEEFENKFVVTEAYTSLPEIQRMYRAGDSKLYSPFNFALITLPWKARMHKDFLDEYDGVVGERYFPTHVLGNHDKPRIASRVGEAQARVAAMLLLTARGIPFIYYGDEIGMKDGDIPFEQVKDIWEKNMPGLKLGRDPQRTPMQWSGQRHAGFSTVEPWLPVGGNYKERNVEIEEKNPNSTLHLYKNLIEFRKKSNALCKGTYTSIESGDDDVLIFERRYKEEGLLVVLNFSNESKTLKLPYNDVTIAYNTYLDQVNAKHINLENFSIRENEGMIIDLVSKK